MKGPSFVILLAILTAACGTPSDTSAGGLDPSGHGGVGGSPMTTSIGGQTSTSVGGWGGTGGGSDIAGSGGAGGGSMPACPPYLSFDAEAAYVSPVGPYVDEQGGFFGARLSDAPLATAVTCKTLVVGLATYSNPSVCALPAEVRAVAWSDAGTIESETGSIIPASLAQPASVLVLADAAKVDFGSGAWIFRFAAPSAFAAGEYPFAALRLEPLLCGVLTPIACVGGEALRYRPLAPGEGWSPLAHAKSDAPVPIPDLVGYQFAIGVDDCEVMP